MTQLPTAKEFFNQWDEVSGDTFEWELMMKEFAKLHVKAALEAASEKAHTIHIDCGILGVIEEVDKDSILNAYPLTNIK